MSFIEDIKRRAKSKKMRIVLPESMDKRVMEAASIAIESIYLLIICIMLVC